jgi:hypothetical protein
MQLFKYITCVGLIWTVASAAQSATAETHVSLQQNPNL